MQLMFYLHASLAVVAMGMAMITKNAVHALLYAVLSLLGVAISMYALSAPLAASLEAIIYAGAIMVLFVFTVMLLKSPTTDHHVLSRRRIYLALVAFALFWGELTFVLAGGFFHHQPSEHSIQEIALVLFNKHSLLLEAISFLLLAGLLTAVFIGQRFMHSKETLR